MTHVELSPNPELSGELMLPPALYHTAPLDRHESIAKHGIVPRDDSHNPGGVSGVALAGDTYEFPGRVYLSVTPYFYSGDRVVYAVDTSVLEPSLLEVDEDNYPTGSGNQIHRPELDTIENINLALVGLPSATRSGVSGLRRSVAYRGIILPEALIPVLAYESVEGSITGRRIDPPKMKFESPKLRKFLDDDKQRNDELERQRQQSEWKAHIERLSRGDVPV